MTDQEHVPKNFQELCETCADNPEYTEMMVTQYEILEERLIDGDDDLGERLSMSLGGLINTGFSPKPGGKGGKSGLTSASMGGIGAISCKEEGGDDNELFV